MPVSSHLLRKLQESLGMDAASELANIVETVDAIRADLAEFRHETRRELDAINARLDDINARFDDVNTKFDDINARFDDVNTKFDDINARFDDVNTKFGDINARFDGMSARIDAGSARMDGLATKAELAELKGEVMTGFQAVRAELHAALHLQTRWMLGGLVTVLLAIYFRS